MPLVGAEAFGLTEKDVEKALAEAMENAKGFRELLDDPNQSLRESAASFLESVEQQIQVLSGSPKDVLDRVKSMYNRTMELGSTGFDEEGISEKLSTEFPDLSSYYGLLRMKAWGYRLGQSVIAHDTKNQNNR